MNPNLLTEPRSNRLWAESQKTSRFGHGLAQFCHFTTRRHLGPSAKLRLLSANEKRPLSITDLGGDHPSGNWRGGRSWRGEVCICMWITAMMNSSYVALFEVKHLLNEAIMNNAVLTVLLFLSGPIVKNEAWCIIHAYNKAGRHTTSASSQTNADNKCSIFSQCLRWNGGLRFNIGSINCILISTLFDPPVVIYT